MLQKIEEDRQSSTEVRTEDLVAYLTDSSFDKTIKYGSTFVKFLAPWCAHCKRLSPVWDDLARKLVGTPGLRVAKVDCSQFEKLCDREKIDGYPTLILFKDGERVAEYEDERTVDRLHSFLAGHVPELKSSPASKKDEL